MKESKTIVLGETLISALCRGSAGEEDATMRLRKSLYFLKKKKDRPMTANEISEQVNNLEKRKK